jgi:hypothetical protein
MSPRRPDVPIEPSTRTLPDRLADELIARIFTGELAPNERLSPERTLAEELGVDRTSLRVALRQLSRMNLLRATQGSGITVLDYRRHAGIDFLAAVLEVPGLELGGAFLLEALDQWNVMMPRFVASALADAQPEHLREIDAFFEAQLRARWSRHATDACCAGPGDRARGRAAGPAWWTCWATSRCASWPTPRAASGASSRACSSVWWTRAPSALRSGPCSTAPSPRRSPPEVLINAHAAYLSAHHQALRAHILTLPQQPYRTSSWTRAAH